MENKDDENYTDGGLIAGCGLFIIWILTVIIKVLILTITYNMSKDILSPELPELNPIQTFIILIILPLFLPYSYGHISLKDDKNNSYNIIIKSVAINVITPFLVLVLVYCTTLIF